MPLRETPEADEPVETPSPDDDDFWVFDSSRVAEAAYDRAAGNLYVRFQRPTPGQVEYIYRGIPASVWRNFKRSQSPGRFVNRILNQYDYERTSH